MYKDISLQPDPAQDPLPDPFLQSLPDPSLQIGQIPKNSKIQKTPQTLKNP